MAKKKAIKKAAKPKRRKKAEKPIAPAIPEPYGPSVDATIADRICELIEDTPKGLDHICGKDGLVSARTFHRWLDKSAELRQRYARAKERQADLLGFQTIEIADTPQMGTKTKTASDGTIEVIEGDMIEHRRLQVDVRKWLTAKLNPKKWGDRQQIQMEGEMSGTIKIVREVITRKM